MSKPAGRIRVIKDARKTPEGGTTAPYELPEFGGERTVLVSGGSRRDQEYILPAELLMGELLDRCGLAEDRVKAICLGWPSGHILPTSDRTAKVKLECETLYAVSTDECIVDVLVRLAQELRDCSCGRCVFGREGTYQMHLTLSDIAGKKARSTDLEQLAFLCGLMRTQTNCSMGQTAANAVLDALEGFRQEIEAHIAERVCPHHVCREFVSYYIDPAVCSGCTECVDACDEDAIIGKRGMIHILEQDDCEKCGACAEACPVGAVRITGGAVPRVPSRPIPCGTWK